MASWCYVATNSAFPHLVKIGSTERDPADRIRELNTTGVPSPFKLAYAVQVDSGETLERRAHTALRHCRHQDNREFFEASVQEAVRAIKAEIAVRGMQIHFEDDADQKAQQVAAELERRERIRTTRSKLEAVADKGRQEVDRRRKVVIDGPVPYSSVWASVSDQFWTLAGGLVAAGIGIALVANTPWTIILVLPVAVYVWRSVQGDNERAKKASTLYVELDRKASLIEKRLHAFLENAERVDDLDLLLKRFEAQVAELLRAGTAAREVAPPPTQTPHRVAETAIFKPLPPFQPRRRWLKTGNGLQELNDRVHIPFSVLRYIEEDQAPRYEVSDTTYYKAAPIVLSDVQDRGWTEKVVYHCPTCDRQHRLDKGLAGASLICACKKVLHLSGDRLELAPMRT